MMLVAATMPDLFVNTGHTFNIYSMGDGLYMQHVLNGIAMLSNSGLLITLGAIGLVMGLLFMGFQGVATGLQKVELSYLLVSFLVFVMMFGMRANVVVHDLGQAPGSTAGGVFPVDNVPFGLAAAGSIISTISLNLTEKMEQGFGSATEGQANGVTGFGRTLEWINAIRTWNFPALANSSKDATLPNALKNQQSYIHHCTMVAAEAGKLNLELANNAANPWSKFGTDTSGGLGYNNNFLTFPFIKSGGTKVALPCGSGESDVLKEIKGQKLYSKFAAALVPRSKPFMVASSVGPAQQMTDAFNRIGVDQDDAMKYVELSSSLAAERTAFLMGGHATGVDEMSAVMINQAENQRSTQWGANETMFRSIVRPMIAFFESMIYACAPFMALVVGFGAWGIKMVGRYCILTIWVGLWLPVMSICNLFEVTMAQHAVKAMSMAAAHGGSALSMQSLAATAQLQHDIANWMSVGAMLASATPAITLMLIFGGAMTATSLAGRLHGQDFVNEKETTPDTAKPPAVMDVSPMATHNQAEGTFTAGSQGQMPSWGTQSVAKNAVSSGSSAVQRSASQYMASAMSGLSATDASSISGSTSSSHAASHDASMSVQSMAKWGRTHGLDVNSGNEALFTLAMAAELGGKGGLSAGILKKAGITAGISGGLMSKAQTAQQVAQKLGEFAKQDAQTGHGIDATAAQATRDVLSHGVEEGSRQAQQVTGSDDYKHSLQDFSQKQKQFQQTQEEAASVGSNQKVSLNALSQSIMRSGHYGDVMAMARRDAGASVISYNEQTLRNSTWAPHDRKQRQLVAALMAIHGDGPSRLWRGNKAVGAASRGRDQLQAMRWGGMATDPKEATAATGDASRNEGVASGVHSGNAQRQTEDGLSNRPRPPTSASSVVAQTNKTIQSGGRNDEGQVAGLVTGAGSDSRMGHEVSALGDGDQLKGSAANGQVEGEGKKQMGAISSEEKGQAEKREKAVYNKYKNNALHGIHRGAGQWVDTAASGLKQTAKGTDGADFDTTLGAVEASGVTLGTRGPIAGAIQDKLNDLPGNEPKAKPALTNRVNSTYRNNLALINSSISAMGESQPLRTARAVVSTYKQTKHMTPQMATAYKGAYEKMTPGEKINIGEIKRFGDGSNPGQFHDFMGVTGRTAALGPPHLPTD